MSDALLIFAPLFAFMFIPVWIPLVAVAVGGATDAMRSSRR